MTQLVILRGLCFVTINAVNHNGYVIQNKGSLG